MKGHTMSHSKRTIANKNQQNPKTQFNRYLYNENEPEDNMLQDDAVYRLQVKADKYYMIIRRKIRRDARNLRMG